MLRSVADARGIKPAQLIHATRVAITGRSVSPGLYEVLELIGRARSCARIEHTASLSQRVSSYTVCAASVSAHTPAELRSSSSVPVDSTFFAC